MPLTPAHEVGVLRTVWVPDALWTAAGDGVGLGHQSGLAPTDWIAAEVERAHSS